MNAIIGARNVVVVRDVGGTTDSEYTAFAGCGPALNRAIVGEGECLAGENAIMVSADQTAGVGDGVAGTRDFHNFSFSTITRHRNTGNDVDERSSGSATVGTDGFITIVGRCGLSITRRVIKEDGGL